MVRILQQFILTTIFAIFASQASAMFIQADWFDPTESGVGTNRYAYSNNDPVNRFDPGGNQSIDSQTNEYLSEGEYNQAADDVDREIKRLQNEWDNDPLRNDKAYEYDIEQLKRKAETYRHYAGASARERLDHFRQGLVAPAAEALTLGVGVQQPAASTMPRMSPVVGSVPTEAAALRAAAGTPFRNTILTVSGRALTKHPNVAGFSNGEALSQSLRNPQAINQAADSAVGRILSEGTRTQRTHPRFGEIIDYTLPSGIGARFGAANRDFITFLGR